jgi:hypothetical protein
MPTTDDNDMDFQFQLFQRNQSTHHHRPIGIVRAWRDPTLKIVHPTRLAIVEISYLYLVGGSITRKACVNQKHVS